MATTKNLTVELLLKAIDEMSGPIRQVAGSIKAMEDVAENTQGLKELGDNLRSMGTQSIIAGGAILASLAAPIAAFKDLQDAETRAQVAFMTRSGTDTWFSAISKEAVRLGNLLPGTTRDFEQMAAQLKEMGISSESIANGGLEATADLRVLINGVSPEDAADLVATFKNSLHVADADFKELVDTTQKAHFSTGLGLNDFSETLKYIGPLLNQMGVSGKTAAEQILTLAGEMSKQGIRGSMLGTALREMALQLASVGSNSAHSAKYLETLGKAGIQLEFYRNGKFLGIQNLLEQLEKLNALNPQDKILVLQEIFGQRAATALAAISSLGAKGFQQAQAQLQDQASLADRLKTVLGSLSSHWEAASGTVVNMLASIGRSLGPILNAALSAVNTIAAAVQGFAERHQVLTATLAVAVGVVGLLVTAFGAFTFALGTAFIAASVWPVGLAALSAGLGIVTGMLGGAIAATWAWTAALLANPITWIVAGVIALAVSVYEIFKHWSAVKGFFAEVWHWLRAAGTQIFDAGANLVNMLWSGIKSVASKPVQAFRSIVQHIRDHLPFSPAKVGPLKDLHRVKMMETLASSMQAAPAIRAMRTALAAAVAMPVIASTGTAGIPLNSAPRAAIYVTYSPTVTIGAGANPAMKSLVEELLAEHKAELLRAIEDATNDKARTSFKGH